MISGGFMEEVSLKPVTERWEERVSSAVGEMGSESRLCWPKNLGLKVWLSWVPGRWQVLSKRMMLLECPKHPSSIYDPSIIDEIVPHLWRYPVNKNKHWGRNEEQRSQRHSPKHAFPEKLGAACPPLPKPNGLPAPWASKMEARPLSWRAWALHQRRTTQPGGKAGSLPSSQVVGGLGLKSGQGRRIQICERFGNPRYHCHRPSHISRIILVRTVRDSENN